MPVKEGVDLLVRLDRVILSRQQDRVIERQASPDDLADRLDRCSHVTKAAVVAPMPRQEMDIRKSAQGSGYAPPGGVIGLPVDMDEEVRCLAIELKYEPDQLVGKLVSRHDVGEIHRTMARGTARLMRKYPPASWRSCAQSRAAAQRLPRCVRS